MVNFFLKFIIFLKRDQKKLIAEKLFVQADKDGSKTLTFEETKKILQKLHIEITKDYLKDLFENYDKDKNNAIDVKEFQNIIVDIAQKKEVIQIFKENCPQAKKSDDLTRDRNQEMMNEEDFLQFSKKIQKENISGEEFRGFVLWLRDCNSQKSLSQFLDNSHWYKEMLKISLSEFASLLFSTNNCIFDPNKREVYQVFLIVFRKNSFVFLISFVNFLQ